MAQDAYTLRRRAAMAVLRPVLDDAALIDALWEAQNNMRADGISDVIGYIDSVARRNLLDTRTTKRLYEELFKLLRGSGAGLPDDPLPMMQAARAVQSVGGTGSGGLARSRTLPLPAFTTAPVPPARPPMPAPVPVAMPAPMPIPAPVAAPTPEQLAAHLPAEQVVFGALMRALLAEMQQFHGGSLEDLRTDLLKDLPKVKISNAVRQLYKEAWVQPMQHAWHLNGPDKELASLIHHTYVGLCETLGPVDADQVLARAVRSAERLPQARQFPPKRFL